MMTDESLQAKLVIYGETKACQDQMPATYNLDITITYLTNKNKTLVYGHYKLKMF